MIHPNITQDKPPDIVCQYRLAHIDLSIDTTAEMSAKIQEIILGNYIQY
jgi:hypothetical protein